MAEPKALILDVRYALEGNQKSYKAIYDYLCPILRKTIKHKVYGVPCHLVQDILQDVFVKLFLHLHTYRPDYSFTSWAISIALHHVIDLSRKQRLDIELSDNIESYEYRFPEMEFDCHLESAGPRHNIFDLTIQHLDENNMSVIMEKYYTGLKQKEIAIKWNKPIGSISGIQANAIRALRTKVRELRLDRGNF